MLENLNLLIEINLKLLNEATNNQMWRTEFKNENGRQLSDSLKFAQILEEKKLIILEKSKGFRCNLTELGFNIYHNGGWTKYLNVNRELENDILEKNLLKEKFEIENLSASAEVNRWYLKTKWYPHFFSGLSIIVSIFLGVIAYQSDRKSEVQKEEINLLKKNIESVIQENKRLNKQLEAIITSNIKIKPNR